MRRRRRGIVPGALGLLLLLFYLAVRLFFMERLDAAIAAANVHGVGDIVARPSAPVVIWLAWAYSFRVGMLLAVIGGALRAGMRNRGIGLIALGGILYLATCYVPFIAYSPRYYGILGIVILLLFLLLVWEWMSRRPMLTARARAASDLRMVGHYFLVTATWSLCGIFGIVTFALQPEIMLARGLRSAAAMLTSHVMVELTLGWFLLFVAARKERRDVAGESRDAAGTPRHAVSLSA